MAKSDTVFRKVSTRIWWDEKFTQLSPTDKLVALYILTGPERRRLGFFTISPSAAAEHCGIAVEGAGKGIDRVSIALSWRWDAATRTMLIPRWLHYQPPMNAKHLRGMLKDIEEVPNSPFWPEFMEILRPWCDKFEVDFDRVSIGYGIEYRYQEQEREREQEKDKAAVADKQTSQPATQSVTGSPESEPPSSATSQGKKKRFTPPTVWDVQQYVEQHPEHTIDVRAFLDHHEARGWILSNGRQAKDWRACVRTWHRNGKRFNHGPVSKAEAIFDVDLGDS